MLSKAGDISPSGIWEVNVGSGQDVVAELPTRCPYTKLPYQVASSKSRGSWLAKVKSDGCAYQSKLSINVYLLMSAH